MTETTTAALLTAPHRIELVDRKLPAPGPGQVRIRMTQCGVCASDVDMWTGRSAEQLPAAIGHEVAGVVEEVGEEVTSLTSGDHVVAWIDDGFAERALAAERYCVAVDPGVSYPAVAEPLACVVNTVELAAPELGDVAVIIGAGYMGNLIQLLSALKGPRAVVVADLRADALARAAALGATRVVDTASESLDGVVRDLTDARGADVVYEVTGVEPGLVAAGEVARVGGKLAIVGYHQGGSRTIPLGRWNWNALQLVNAHFREPETVMRGMRAGMRLVNAGALDPSPLVSHRFPLVRIADAFETATAKPDGFVKAVIEQPEADRPGAGAS